MIPSSESGIKVKKGETYVEDFGDENVVSGVLDAIAVHDFLGHRNEDEIFFAQL